MAISEKSKSPLDGTWEKTGESFSVLKVIPDGQPQNIVCKESIGYTLYSKFHPKGPVKIALAKKPGSRDSYILFVTLNTAKTSLESCGGELQTLTFKHEDFKSCEESSNESDSKGCKAGISGTMADSAGNMWVAKNENSGAWVEYKFKTPYQIGVIEFKNRDDVKNQASLIQFEFKDKSKIKFSPKKLSGPQKVEFPKAVITDTVKI